MGNKKKSGSAFSSAVLESAPPSDSGLDGRSEVVASALAASFTVREIWRSVEVATHVDSADWRLLRSGLHVLSIRSSGDLMAYGRDGGPVVQAGGSVVWPALVSRLPAGPVRNVLVGPMGVRALIPCATTRTDVTSYAVLNEDAKTVARVHWRDIRLDSPIDYRLPGVVELEGLRGYGAELARVRRLLVAHPTLSVARETWLDRLRTVAGIGPDETQRFGMQRDQAADLAVADALLGYLAVIESTVEGIVADVDTEFLHDFRVAVRRTRSVLKLLGGVLPAGMAERVGAEFRWLGDVTTPTRDLDVYLLGLDQMASSLTRPAELDAFGLHLALRRATEHKALVEALRSPRFLALRTSWRSELGDLMSAPSHLSQTAGQLAELQLHRTYRKVTKRAKAIGTDSPSEEVHALRKKCKEMRYVLDVFKPLCDPKAYKLVVEDFKGLQDVLGKFQDGEVQASALRVFAGEMLEVGQVDVGAMLAMGGLAARFDVQQQAARATLVKHHDDYFGARSAGHVHRLVRA